MQEDRIPSRNFGYLLTRNAASRVAQPAETSVFEILMDNRTNSLFRYLIRPQSCTHKSIRSPYQDSSASFQLTSFHFGTPGQGKKVYIQAALHADEVPGMLVAQFLRTELAALEAEGKIRGEIILVPAANPIGLSQAIHGAPFGRFDLSTGINFNRAYKHVADDLKASLEGKLGPDAGANVALVREHARALGAPTGSRPPTPKR